VRVGSRFCTQEAGLLRIPPHAHTSPVCPCLQRIPEWIDAGYDANTPSVIDLFHGMADAMRNLASAIVVRSSGSGGVQLPELGAPYSEVLTTVWRAVAAVCRDDVVSVRSTPAAPQPLGETSGKDLHTGRADALAVGAQVTGRLTTAAAQAATIEGPDGAHAVSLDDLVAVLVSSATS
jgi:hypothetical protein